MPVNPGVGKIDANATVQDGAPGICSVVSDGGCSVPRHVRTQLKHHIETMKLLILAKVGHAKTSV